MIDKLAIFICSKLAGFGYLSAKKSIAFRESLINAFEVLIESGVEINKPGTVYESFFKQEEVSRELWKTTSSVEEVDLDRLMMLFRDSWKSEIPIDEELVRQALQIFCKELKHNLQKHEEFQIPLIAKKVDSIDATLSQIKNSISPSSISAFENPTLISEYQNEIDYAKGLLIKHKPNQALEQLKELKDRIWYTADKIVKFRICTNQGAAYLLLKEEDKASQLFLEALQYNPDDEKALGNAALAYIIIGNYDKAKQIATQIIEKNPGSTNAYGLLVQANPETTIEDLLHAIPENYHKTIDIAYAISFIARKQNKLIESIKWLNIALSEEPDNVEVLGILGANIIESILTKFPSAGLIQLTESDTQELIDAKEYLNKVLNIISSAECRSYWIQCISNRSLAKNLLGDIDGAILDIELALIEEPNDILFLKNRAIYALIKNDFDKAIVCLEKIMSLSTDISEVPLLLAEALIITNETKKAITILEGYLRNKLPARFEESANRLFLEGYIKEGKYDKAEIMVKELIDTKPTVTYIVEAARLAFLMEKEDEAKELFKKAKTQISKNTPPFEIYVTAEELYIQKQFEEALGLYEIIADINVLSEFTEKLVICYYKAGHIGKAIEICEKLRKQYGPSKIITEVAMAINVEIGNLQIAINLCQEYINVKNDKTLLVDLAVLNYMQGNIDEVKSFLESGYDIKELSVISQIKYAELFAALGLMKEYVIKMYEIRRRHYENRLVHLRYMGLFINLTNKENSWLHYDEVAVDTAVQVEDDFGNKTWFILEEEKNIESKLNEINIKDHKAQKLLGKKVGEEVVLYETPFRTATLKVIEIKSKYIYALHSSQNILEKDSTEEDGFFVMKVGAPKEVGALPEGFQPILDSISAKNEIILKGEDFYKKGYLTVGALASLLNYDAMDTFDSLITKSEIGLKCCNGTPEEREKAFAQLTKEPKLIIDLTALLAVYSLNKESIKSNLPKFGIAQSTINIIQEKISRLKGNPSDGFMSIGKEGDSFVKQLFSAEDVKRHLDYLERMIEWVNRNCEILPVTPALKIKRADKEKNEKILGESFYDTVLIANEPGYVLYSDDERLRAFAMSENGKDGIWTQVLLMYYLANNFISREFYDRAIVKLVCSNFHYISIDENVIIEAARQSEWMPKSPFTNVVRLLITSDETSTLLVATKCLYELWNQAILPEKRDDLIYCLIDLITIGRDRKIFLTKLAFLVKKRFHLLPVAETQILQIIQKWFDTHLS